jgi:branched-chain amino acid transport system substrate-binding protein
MSRIGTLGTSAFALLLGLASVLPAADDTIVFGAAISITGKTAKEGEYTRDGYQFAIDKLNESGGIKVGGRSYRLALKYYDDETKPERTAQLIEKLINEDKVNLVLGPYGSSPTGTAAPICERYRIPMVEANGAAESIFAKGYKYSFMILSPAKGYLRGIIDLVRSKDPNAKTVAILGENESFSKEVAQGAAEHARQAGMQVVYDELYPTNAQDVSALVTAIKGKNPDLVLGSGHLQDSLLIVKQSRDLGLSQSPASRRRASGPCCPRRAR